MATQKTQPRALVLSGYGLNCESETAHGFVLAGATADIVHIEELKSRRTLLRQYDILAVPGGFSYADDTGSGRGYANMLNHYLSDEIEAFLSRDTLTIGICNGFQILTQMGVLPGALVHNDTPRYLTRWVDVRVESDSPWLKGLETLSVPIAHGEGKYYAPERDLDALQESGAHALSYSRGDISTFLDLPGNPNGSLRDIAGVTARDGRVLGMMPHPERALYFTQLPHWTLRKRELQDAGKRLPRFAEGRKIFDNAVRYFA